MKIGGSFFRSKVAQRIFILFILCAMLPVLVLSFLSYTQVSKQLKDISLNRLKNLTKAHGMSIYERFLFLETNMQLIASGDFKDNKYLPEIYLTNDFNKKILHRFEALALIKTSGEFNLLYGEFKDFPDNLIDNALTIGDEKTTLIFETFQNKTPAKVYMLMKTIPDHTGNKVLVGEINISYLWGIGYHNILPHNIDLCIINQVRKVVSTSFPPTDDLLHQVTMKIDGATPLAFKYKEGKNTYFASYWPMFLKSRFDAVGLNVILRNNSADALVPLSNFKKIFPLVLLLSFWIVLLLSIIHIRKSLVPLEKLKEGTLRIAKQDFKNRVLVTSNDEFEDLADSFNLMSHQLGQHFEALSTRADIDRAILSSLDTKKIIYTVLKRMFVFFSCDSISVNLAVEKQPDTFHAYISTDIKVRKPVEEFFRIPLDDKKILPLKSNHLIVHTKEKKSALLSKADNQSQNLFLILPLFFDNILKGTIALGYSKEKSFSDDDLKHAHQMADQMMVALSNSSLVEDLEKLNIGTLEALARAVDAKSAWTAGHSERVTSLSLKIAKVMGYTTKELEVLRRAAFLHDIGKIGVPLSILDKPGKLNDEEFTKIKDHPSIGLRILEPISAYEDVLPMVSQHHEKFNGKGYPYGLSGEDIDLGARILAVADVYDAVVSDRPYRDGWVEEKAIKMITKEAGEHFDPKVVEAFLAAI